MLQPVDFAVAFVASYLKREEGMWSPARIREVVPLPWASLHLSLSRLEAADVVRDGRVHSLALSALLPALRYLVPARVDLGADLVLGVPTGVSAPAFGGAIVMSVPMVWPSERGSVLGLAVQPLHPVIPEAVLQNPGAYAVLAALDAVRTGKAREFAAGARLLEALVDIHLPQLAA